MNPLGQRVRQRPGDGAPARELLRDDREWVVCFSCPTKHGRNVRHPLRPGMGDHDAGDFAERHPMDQGHMVLRVTPQAMERAVRAAEHRKRLLHHATAGFLDNATVLEAFGTVTALDLTAIGIAVSSTAGWCSCWIDNSSTLYLDIAVWYFSQAVNTAKASQNAHFLYGPGSFLTTDLPTNTAGNGPTNSASVSAILTYNDITTTAVGWPLLKVCPYVTTNKPIHSGGLFGFAKGHDMTCPKVVWLGMVNAAGPTIATGGSPATAIKYSGCSNTVV